MLKHLRPRVPSLPTAISLLALSVVVTGTAYAATGQLVNITDPVTAANKAKVSATGALSTTATVNGTVAPAPPKAPFNHNGLAFADGFFTPLFSPTTATLAVTGIRMSNSLTQPTFVTVQQYPSPSGSCAEVTGARFVGAWQLPAQASVVEPLETPIVLKPLTTGGKWCLGTIASGTSGHGFWINLTGYTVAGTFAPSRPAQTRGTVSRDEFERG